MGVAVVQDLDTILLFLLRSLASVLPDFGRFGTVRFVADGYDISGNLLLQNVLIGLAYLAGLYVIGYFLLRTREVAR